MPTPTKTEFNELMAGLKNEERCIRSQTIDTLDALRNREAIDAFKNTDAPKGQFSNFVPTLFSLMLHDSCSVIREKAFDVLNRIGVNIAGPSITKALLSDKDDNAMHLMVANVFEVLLRLEQHMPAALKEVLPLLQDEIWYHDLVTARTWTASQIPQLVDFSNLPPNPVVQEISPLAATEFLILEAHVPQAIETLFSLLKNNSWYVRLIAANALTRTSVFLESQVPLVIQILLPFLNDNNPQHLLTKRMAFRFLQYGERYSKTHTGTVIQLLLPMFQDPFFYKSYNHYDLKRLLEDQDFAIPETEWKSIVQALVTMLDDNIPNDHVVINLLQSRPIPEEQISSVIQALSLKLNDYWNFDEAQNTLAAIAAQKKNTSPIREEIISTNVEELFLSPPLYAGNVKQAGVINVLAEQTSEWIEPSVPSKAPLGLLPPVEPKAQLSIELSGVVDPRVLHDARTGTRIYRMNFFPPERPALTDGKNTTPIPREPIGSVDLYGAPIPCRSGDGTRTNMMNPQGVIASQLPDPHSIETICDSLPPTLLESAQMGIEMGMEQGFLSGATNVMGRAICPKSSSENVIQAVQILLYNSFYFTLRCQAHLAQGQPIEATLYDAAIETSQMFVASTAGKMVSAVGEKVDKKLGLSKLGTALSYLGKSGPLLYSAYQRGAVDTGAYVVAASLTQEFVEEVGNRIVHSLKK